jgi:kynurenine 3-monooxygenase
MNYQQEYIEHGYKELTIPPDSVGTFALDPNYLHIWPRESFMMIALPNPDRSFTCTLFMSYDQFGRLATSVDVVNFFQHHFPDMVSLAGSAPLVREFFDNPVGSLMSIKVSSGRAIICTASLQPCVSCQRATWSG